MLDIGDDSRLSWRSEKASSLLNITDLYAPSVRRDVMAVRRWTPPEPAYDVVVDRDVMIPMRDGVRLNTDIYRPARHGGRSMTGYPPIWNALHTANPTTGGGNNGALDARHGYVVMIQDVRGRYRSDGTFGFLA